MQLRYLETLTVIAADKNSTIVFRCRWTWSGRCSTR
jgi:hypothetical protein